MSKKLNAMETLIKILDRAKVPYEVTPHHFNSVQLWYPNKKHKVCDVIFFPGSYGYERNLLEIMGLTKSKYEIDGDLTPQEVFNRIYEHYLAQLNN